MILLSSCPSNYTVIPVTISIQNIKDSINNHVHDIMILINYKINIITNTTLVVPQGVLDTSHQDDSHALPIIPIHEFNISRTQSGNRSVHIKCSLRWFRDTFLELNDFVENNLHLSQLHLTMHAGLFVCTCMAKRARERQ